MRLLYYFFSLLEDISDYLDIKLKQTKKRLDLLSNLPTEMGSASMFPLNINGVSIWPIRREGSWGYLIRSWLEATPYFVIILINIRKMKKLNDIFVVNINQLSEL